MVGPRFEFQRFCEDYLDSERLASAPTPKNYPSEYRVRGCDLAQEAEELAGYEQNRWGLGDGPVLALREVLEAEVGAGARSSPPGTRTRLEGSGFRARGARALLGLVARPEAEPLLAARYELLATQAFRDGVLSAGQFSRLLRAGRAAMGGDRSTASHS